jgi:hypothetical protein
MVTRAAGGADTTALDRVSARAGSFQFCNEPEARGYLMPQGNPPVKP